MNSTTTTTRALQRSFILTLLAAAAAASCVTPDSGQDPKSAASANNAQTGETRSFQMAGPQSFTPEVKPKGRDRAVRLLWTSNIGRTDYRSTFAFAERSTIYIGTAQGKYGEAGIHVIDGKTGHAARAVLPAARGNVVGIALEGDRVYSTSSAGEVAATTKAGYVLFRSQLGSAAVTPPTLVDIDGDGTLEVAVGDAKGHVTVLDGTTGKSRWTRALSDATEGHPSIGAALATADLDGDGAKEIVVGTEGGQLFALRGKSGETAWKITKTSPLRAAPIITDVNADKRLEVVAGWADGDVAIIDAKAGTEVWSQHVEQDNGDPTGLLASPTPIPNANANAGVGSLLVPTARWGKEDVVVVLRAHDRAYQSKQGSVVASPVIGAIQQGTPEVEAIVGTTLGDVVTFTATGEMSFLFRLDGPIEASPMIADLEGNGLQELIVATRDGKLNALAIHATTPPLLSRARGNSLRNDGVVSAIDLGWQLP